MRPVLLLIAVGFLIAVAANLAKGAAGYGILAPEFAWLLSAGSGVALLVASALSGKFPRLTRTNVIYYVVTGFLSIAAPNLINFEIARRIGAGYASIPFALSPLITYALAIFTRIDQASTTRIVGILLGLVGTAFIVLDANARSTGVAPIWFLISLAVPILVASGNIYRTLRWPKGADPLPLAGAMIIASAIWLSPFAFSRPMVAFSNAAIGMGEVIILVQIAASALMYWLYFKLQQAAGPVYLSQIGYVAAAFGVVIALLIFDEAVSIPMIAGFALIVAGVFFVTPRRTSTAKEQSAASESAA